MVRGPALMSRGILTSTSNSSYRVPAPSYTHARDILKAAAISAALMPLASRCQWLRSARAVGVGAVINVDHQDDEPLVEDLVDDPVGATPRTP